MRARAPTSPQKLTTRTRKATPTRAAKPADLTRKREKLQVRIFVSYSHVDKEARRKLETHLAPLKADNVDTWFDGDMDAGEKLDTSIARAMRQAHIFVGLISSDYLASHYCWKVEYKRAMNRRARGTMRVVAVVTRPCDWKSTPAAGFKLLPEDGRSLQEWRSIDAALLDVTRGIRKVVTSVRRDMASAFDKPAVPKRASPTKAGSQSRPKPSTSKKPPRPRTLPGTARKSSRTRTKV